MEHAATNDPLIGVNINNFEVKSRLGEGGMGAVYLAEHPLIGKKVAVKVLHPEFTSNEDVTARFFTEAKAVNDIQHPNIVDIINYGDLQVNHRKVVYFVMEYLAGRSLAHLIRAEAPLPPERALAIALQVADALGASHTASIVHRDLKPDNVMLIQRGREADFVKVLDFGIAKLTGDQHGSHRTRTGIVMGTPAYMSPEQCEGRGNIDHRTDIYALGILLYEMLTGQVPFQGEGYGEVLVKHLTQPPMRPSTIMPVIPAHVEAIVLKALEKNPANRYPSMEELIQALVDPVGYVEARGGIAAFLSNAAMPSTAGAYAPVTDASGVVTPGVASMPMTPYTPVPGQMTGPGSGAVPMYTPLPGAMQPSRGYTTLGAGAAEVTEDPGPGSLRRMLVIGVAAVVFVGIGGGILMLMGGDKDPEAVASATIDAAPATAVLEQPPAILPPPGDQQLITGETGTAGPDATAAEVEPAITKVTIKVASRPEGAEVYVNDEDEPRGTTPATFEVAKTDEEVSFTLKLDGYKDEMRAFVPDRAKEFDLTLQKERSSRRRSSQPSSTNSSNKPATKPTTKPPPKPIFKKPEVKLEDPEF